MKQKTLFGNEIDFLAKIKTRTKRLYKELVDEISKINLNTLAINPYVITVVFTKPKEIINYFFYQTITRKISGKVGKYIENLLSYLSDGDSELREFDLKKIKNGIIHHIEIKTTTNTMRGAEMKKFFVGDLKKDKDKWGVIPSYQRDRPNECFKLGTSFGENSNQKHMRTVNRYVERMLEDYSDLVEIQDKNNIHLCGTKLWDFFSGEKDFLKNKVIPILMKSFGEINKEKSIIDIINEKLDSIINDFTKKYKSGVSDEDLLNNFI